MLYSVSEFIQGLVDNAGTHITFGPILAQGFSAESIGKYISIADTLFWSMIQKLLPPMHYGNILK